MKRRRTVVVERWKAEKVDYNGQYERMIEWLRVRTCVVMRYETKASLVPSFSLMGVPTVHSNTSLPSDGASISRPVPGAFISWPGSSAGGTVRDVWSWTCSLHETLEKSSCCCSMAVIAGPMCKMAVRAFDQDQVED